MHSPERMMKSRVNGTRINKVGDPKLFDSSEPLNIRVLNNVVDQFVWDGNESVNGIVNDFLFVQGLCGIT